jgi:uncharacterized protein
VVNSHGRFAWYELITTEAEAARIFYTKVVGWTAWDASVPGRAYILFIAREAPVCGLVELPEAATKQGARPSWVGYVGVGDVDATAERIRSLGGSVLVPPTDVADISRFAMFADPQSARLALFKWRRPGRERSAEPDEPGGVGWHELLAEDPEQALAFYGALFGWEKANANLGETDAYQLFSVGGQAIGGMLAKPATMPAPFWLYYFNVGDIDAAAQRVAAAGGEILNGPLEVPGGSWIVQCTDPQGAIFALEGKRRPRAVGYFERVASRNPGVGRGRRWSW